MALYDTFNGEDIEIPAPSPEEAKRISLEVTGWLWGTVKGCFNRKMTTSQIVVDAIIGVIPLVGDVTAVRDLIATVIGMVKDPARRKEVLEWVLMVVLLLALIPVAGGVVKGVGRLLMRTTKTAAESRGLLKEIITFLNRMGNGNAVKFIKELDLLKHERKLVREFGTLMDRFTLVFEKIETKMGWLITQEMKDLLGAYKKGVKELKALGSEMIPKAVKDLNNKLKELQKVIYEGEWVGIKGQGKNVTREAEARLVEGRIARAAKQKMKFPQNPALAGKEFELDKFYKHKSGWPDLRMYEDVNAAERKYFPDIAAFSGEIRPISVHGPVEIKRVINLGKNGVTRPWWLPPGVTPKNARQWREEAAVLDSFGHNGWIVTCLVPEGTELKAWEGTVASQIDKKAGQYLEGGGKQVFLDLGAASNHEGEMVKAFRSGAKEFKTSEGLVFKIEETRWTDAVGIYGFEGKTGRLEASTEALDKYERQSKAALAGARVTHGIQQQPAPQDWSQEEAVSHAR